MAASTTSSGSSEGGGEGSAWPPPRVAPADLAPRELGFDEMLLLAGGFGRYQRLQTMIACAAYGVCAATLLLPNFLLPRVTKAWPHFKEKEDGAMVTSIFFVGNTIGLVVWGVVADVWGRRRCLLLAFALLLPCAALQFASTGVASLATTRVLAGFCVGGVMNAGVVLLTEIAAMPHRMYGKTCIALTWVVGVLWTVGIAYAVRSTQWQLLVLYLLPAPPMLGWAVLQLRESPRFMLAKGWHAPATASLRRIAATNGASLPANLTLALPPAPSPRHGLRGKLGGFGELWHPALRARSALVGVAWFGSTSTYYGVVLAGGQPGDLYVRNALGAILELPAYVLMPVLGERWGRRRTWSFFLLVFTAAIAAVALCGGKLSGAWALVLSLLARFGAAGASTIVYVAAAEQWPTTCRNLGVGYGASMGRLGSILAPLVGLTPYPTAVLAVVGGAAAAAALALPETQGKAIPETLGPASTGSLDHDTSPVSHVGVPREVPGLRAELPGEEPTSDLLREVDRTSSKNASTEELPSYPRR